MSTFKKNLKTASILLVSTFLINCGGGQEKLVVNAEIAKKLSNHSERDLYETDNFVVITPKNEKEAKELKEEISHLAHESGKCGGFSESTESELEEITEVLKAQNTLNNSYDESTFSPPEFNESIEKLNENLKTDNVKNSIELLMAQGTRSARTNAPNKPIEAFIEHIKKTLKNSKVDYTLDRIKHNRTQQDSIRVRVEGSTAPEKVVILGGHIDSTTSFFSRKAPGADDNASGSSVILEVMRVLLESDYRPKNSIEFFWYAGEENGLLGSKEIARSYKENSVDVRGVMQLDMVLFPGNGDVIGLTTDNTNAELTRFTEELTTLYVGDPVERFKCGYGCSDHASWHQNGFKAVFPFESTFNTSNKNIHTERDVIDNRSSLDHAIKFGKIAVAFLVEFSS